jgi:hypothetical protein
VDEVGGPGTIAEFPGAGALVISQTTDIHEHVEKVLAALRRVKQIQGIPALSLPSLPTRHIRDVRRPEAESRSYSAAPAQAWQLPLVHAAE